MTGFVKDNITVDWGKGMEISNDGPGEQLQIQMKLTNRTDEASLALPLTYYAAQFLTGL